MASVSARVGVKRVIRGIHDSTVSGLPMHTMQTMTTGHTINPDKSVLTIVGDHRYYGVAGNIKNATEIEYYWAVTSHPDQRFFWTITEYY